MNYPGNKNIPGLIQKIVNQIPEFDFCYELFAGSAAVTKFLSVSAKGKAEFFINDIDPAVIVNNNYPSGSKVTSVPADDIIQLLISLEAGTETFVFLDPPYLRATRPYSLNLYKKDLSYEDHEKLLSSILDLKCNCMIIHPVCFLYEKQLKSFRKVQVKIRYNRKTSIENIYMNYPEPVRLFTYDMVGSDCWDRQRIKRKGDRLLKKITELPVLEQNYLIDRISHIN